MTERLYFTPQEKEETLALLQELRQQIAPSLQEGDEERLRQQLMKSVGNHQVQRNVFGLNPILMSFQTARLVVSEIGLRRDAVLAVLLRTMVDDGTMTVDEVKEGFGQ